jgi:hypothetical protein
VPFHAILRLIANVDRSRSLDVESQVRSHHWVHDAFRRRLACTTPSCHLASPVNRATTRIAYIPPLSAYRDQMRSTDTDGKMLTNTTLIVRICLFPVLRSVLLVPLA